MTKSKRAQTTMCVLKKKPWFTWAFIAEALAKGGFQAVGSIAVYVAVIWLFLSKTGLVSNAISLRAPMLTRGVGEPEGKAS
jgi:hypothetical protein